MFANHSRRDFLLASPAALALPGAAKAIPTTSQPLRVVVWDERQPEQKQAYKDFLGNQIAGYLRDRPGLTVQSVSIDDSEKGLSPAVMRGCDVLVWWGHRRQAEIAPKLVAPLIERIKEGTLALVALHSAHWSTPFMEAMNERTRQDAQKQLQQSHSKSAITFVDPPRRYSLPKSTDRLTPYTEWRKFPDKT